MAAVADLAVDMGERHRCASIAFILSLRKQIVLRKIPGRASATIQQPNSDAAAVSPPAPRHIALHSVLPAEAPGR
jgi:hypothetical protein